MATLALVDVRDIVEWLQRTEERIGMLYARAAEACSKDPSFCTFLRELSEDEKSHARFMSMASEQLHGDQHRPPIDILNRRHTDFQSETRLVTPLWTMAYKLFLGQKRGFQVVYK